MFPEELTRILFTDPDDGGESVGRGEGLFDAGVGNGCEGCLKPAVEGIQVIGQFTVDCNVGGWSPVAGESVNWESMNHAVIREPQGCTEDRPICVIQD